MAQFYLPASMREYFGDGSKGRAFVLRDGRNPAGFRGGGKNVEDFLDSTFFVLNGDIIQNRDFTAILKFHRQHHAKATVVLTPVADPTHYGVVETDKRNKVKRFLEKPKGRRSHDEHDQRRDVGGRAGSFTADTAGHQVQF